MRIQILSDLHVEFDADTIPPLAAGAELVILAGDLAPVHTHRVGDIAKRWAGAQRILYVPGNAGWKVSTTTVGRLLHELGYRLQSVRKSREGTSHPDRNAQFEHINSKADDFLQRAQPVVTVDTKKKELVGDFKNAGREWQPKGEPEKSMVHDLPQGATGKAIPYGIYDMGRNEAWVRSGCDHDTPSFAVASLRRWCGRRAESDARALQPGHSNAMFRSITAQQRHRAGGQGSSGAPGRGMR